MSEEPDKYRVMHNGAMYRIERLAWRRLWSPGWWPWQWTRTTLVREWRPMFLWPEYSNPREAYLALEYLRRESLERWHSQRNTWKEVDR